MPLYEYQCKTCEKIHEVMQKFSDDPLAACPDCSDEVTKLISLGSFALKGQGWYTTDYKRKGVSDSGGTPKVAAPAATAAAPAAAAPAVATPKSESKS